MMRPIRFLIVLTCVLAHLTGNAATYFVATNGSDSADGSMATPWRTIQKAATMMWPGDTCYVRGGVYRETVVPARSGTATNRITYAAYSNEVVTIMGTEPVTNWTVHSGSIYVANLASNWFNRSMPGGGSRLWDPTVANEANFILCDGVMMPLARWPNSAPGATNLFDLTLPPKSLLTTFVSKTTNANNWTIGVFDDAALPQQPDNAYAGAEIVMQPNSNGMSFVFSGYIAASTNAPGGGTRLTLYSPNDSGKGTEGGRYATNYALGSRYWLWNKMQFLDAPGEWFHDKVAGKLYFWPPDGASPEGRVEARKRRFAFDLSNRSYITVRGFKLVGCTITTDNISGGDNIGYNHSDGVIQLPITKRYPWRYAGTYAPSTNCILEDLDINYPTWFTDVSGHFFGQWGQSSGVIVSGDDHILRNSTIRNSAGAGVVLMGRRNRVLHCLVENVACIPAEQAGIKIGHAAPSEDHEIARNTIRNTGRNGIQLHDKLRCTVPEDPANDWRARIHHNDVYNFCMQDWDCGGLYQGGWAGWVRIDHNWFHSAAVDVDNRPGFGSFTVGGIYLDYSQDAILDHNVIWDVEWGIHLQNVLSQTYPDGNFLCYNNTILVRRNDSTVTYGPFGFAENSSAPHAGTVISNNLIACSQSLFNYKAIDDFPAAAKGNNIGTNGLAGALSALGLNLQGGTNYPDALFPTAASTQVVDRAVLIGTITRNGTNIPPRNDVVVGSAPDIGAYEFGRTPWRAGKGTVDFVSLVLQSATYTVTVGNTNNTIDPGETVAEQVVLWNDNTAALSNVTATLSTTNAGITWLTSTSSYPTFAANGVATNTVPYQYQLAKSLPCGTVLTFTQVATANGTSYTNTFTRTIGQYVAGPVSTNVFYSPDVPRDIVDNATIYSTNNIAGLNGTILGVNVGVRIDHTYDGDLVIAIQHPDTNEVVLCNRRGGGGDNFGTSNGGVTNYTVFDDAGATPIGNGVAPFTNATRYIPEAPLSGLNGKTTDGTWRLRVTDAAAGDTGKVLGWYLQLVIQSQVCQTEVYNIAPLASNQTQCIAADVATNLTLTGSDPDGEPLTFITNSLPAYGMLSQFNPSTGAITYTPTNGYIGYDSFTFSVTDGYATSAVATVTLKVGGAPVITSHPQPQIVTEGSNATFSVTATGIGLMYQWLKNGSNIVGATSASLVLSNVTLSDSGAVFACVVSAECPPPVTSSNAVLTVNPALTPFQQWQMFYFGCTNCPQAASEADPDGDGQNNAAEYLSGTNPTNRLSALRVVAVAVTNKDVRVIWNTAGGRTNVVQAATGQLNATNFTDLSGPIVISGTGDVQTNYLDVNGATNVPGRFYRIRLLTP